MNKWDEKQDFLPGGAPPSSGQQRITARYVPSPLAAKKTNSEGNKTREEL